MKSKVKYNKEGDGGRFLLVYMETKRMYLFVVWR